MLSAVITSPAAQTAAKPAARPITASVMVENGGDQPVYCVMAAFRDRADAIGLLERLTRESTAAQPERAKVVERDAARYAYLRSRPLDTITQGGVFAGLVPDNVVLNGDDLDAVVDVALQAQSKEGGAAC